jgi:hypothetical protein
MNVRSTFAVLFLGVIPASVTLAEPVDQQNQANKLSTVEVLVRPRVSQPKITPVAQNNMVCCKTDSGNTSCAAQYTTWMTKQDCDQFGYQGADGSKTCPDSTCGH